MSRETYSNEINHLATMISATDHFAQRLSERSGKPVDKIMDHINDTIHDDCKYYYI